MKKIVLFFNFCVAKFYDNKTGLPFSKLLFFNVDVGIRVFKKMYMFICRFGGVWGHTDLWQVGEEPGQDLTPRRLHGALEDLHNKVRGEQGFT